MLDRKLSEVGGYGVWDFHRSASSYSHDHGHTIYRYARIKPAEPGDGKPVEVMLLPSTTAPEEAGISVGAGTAFIQSSY